MAQYTTPGGFPARALGGASRIVASVPGYSGSPSVNAGIGEDGLYEVSVALDNGAEVWSGVAAGGAQGGVAVESTDATRLGYTTAADIAGAWLNYRYGPSNAVGWTHAGANTTYRLVYRTPTARPYRDARVIDADGNDIGPLYYAGVAGGRRYWYVDIAVTQATYEFTLQVHDRAG